MLVSPKSRRKPNKVVESPLRAKLHNYGLTKPQAPRKQGRLALFATRVYRNCRGVLGTAPVETTSDGR